MSYGHHSTKEDTSTPSHTEQGTSILLACSCYLVLLKTHLSQLKVLHVFIGRLLVALKRAGLV